MQSIVHVFLPQSIYEVSQSPRPCLIHERIIPVYYNLGLTFVVLAIIFISYVYAVLTKVTAEICKLSDVATAEFSGARYGSCQANRL